jgi:hypothetical protein
MRELALRADQEEFLEYCREQLFGENRSLMPGERNLVKLFWGDFKKKQVKGGLKGGRWLMLMLVDISTFAVIEQAMVQSNQDDEYWRLWFQDTYVDSFANSLEDVVEKAFPEYKAQTKGRRNLHVLCMKYDNMYPHLNAEEQNHTRSDLRKMLNKKLHEELNKKSSSKSRPRR